MEYRREGAVREADGFVHACCAAAAVMAADDVEVEEAAGNTPMML